MRKLLFGAAIGVLVWAVVVVPIPLAVAVPVPATPLGEVIELEGAAVEQLDDRFRFTAVRLEEPTIAGAVGVLFDDQRALSPVPTVTAPGMDDDTFVEFQQRLFRESLRVAVAVGLDRAGEAVEVTGGGVRVLEVLPATPAADALQREDVITHLDGEPVELSSDLASRLAAVDAGAEVEVEFQRDGDQGTATLPVAPLDELADEAASLAIGVLVATVDLELDAPVEVAATADERVGGPSAGLLLALAAYQAASGTDLTAGRTIAGSGTIDTQGRVGRVDGIPQKVRGALDVGAEVFLVPPARVEEARSAAGGRLEVIEVDSIDQAIDALEGS